MEGEKKKGKFFYFLNIPCDVQRPFWFNRPLLIRANKRLEHTTVRAIVHPFRSQLAIVVLLSVYFFFFFFFLSQGRRNRSFFFSPNLFVSYLYGTRFIYFFFPFFRSVSFIPNFPLSMKEFSFFLFVGSMDVKKEDTKKKMFLI